MLCNIKLFYFPVTISFMFHVLMPAVSLAIWLYTFISCKYCLLFIIPEEKVFLDFGSGLSLSAASCFSNSEKETAYIISVPSLKIKLSRCLGVLVLEKVPNWEISNKQLGNSIILHEWLVMILWLLLFLAIWRLPMIYIYIFVSEIV